MITHFISLSTVTTKVTAGAKAFGSFFSGVVNKAGDLGGKIKDTVKHNVSAAAQSAFYRFIN